MKMTKKFISAASAAALAVTGFAGTGASAADEMTVLSNSGPYTGSGTYISTHFKSDYYQYDKFEITYKFNSLDADGVYVDNNGETQSVDYADTFDFLVFNTGWGGWNNTPVGQSATPDINTEYTSTVDISVIEEALGTNGTPYGINLQTGAIGDTSVTVVSLKLKKSGTYVQQDFTAAALAATSFLSSITANAADMNDAFNYMETASGYMLSGMSEKYLDILKELGTTEIVVPSEYNGKPIETYNVKPGAVEDYVTSFDFPASAKTISTGSFGRYNNLKKVVFRYAGAEFVLPRNIASDVQGNSSDSIEEIYIYATSVTVNINSFSKMNPDLKIYVVSEDVKKSIVDATAESTKYVVNESQITVMTDKLDFTALDEEIEKAKTYNAAEYSEDSYTKMTKAIESALALKSDENATQTDIENAITAIKEAIGNLEKLDYSELDLIIKEATDLVENHSDEYTANSMILLKVALTDAKNIRNSSSSQSQNKIDTCGQNLRDCINGLVKIDSVDFKELDEAIAAAEAIDPEKYTDDSYTALYNALEEARILKDNTEAVQEDVNAAVESINNAISALVEKSDSSEESSETSSETSSESSSESSSETSSETGSESSSESSSETSSETGSESSGESDSEASSETGSEGSSESDSEASSQISNDSSEDEDKVANTGAASASGLSILIVAAAAGVIVTKKRSK